MPLLNGNTNLTSREWAITALVYKGYSDEQIAAEMQTTKHVIKTCLRRIFAKTGCWNRTEVALWYLKIGVEQERRFDDRRGANWEINDERRRENRRHPPQRSPRANDQHDINLNE